MKKLHTGDRNQRRWKLIGASRSGDRALLPQLLGRFDRETPDNQRHIVRALGKVGGPAAEARLLELLGSRRGLILGDVAHALGELRSRRAVALLKALRGDECEWVRQNVRFALEQIDKKG